MNVRPFFFIVLLGLSLHLSAYWSEPAPKEDARLCSLVDEICADPISLKVMTYNIRYGKGEDDHVDLMRIVDVINNAMADIIGLQEVERFSPRSQFVNQIRFLAANLGFYGVYGPAFSIGPYTYGNAILSRYPILSWEVVPISSSREPRNFIIATISIKGTPITFVNTHLGLSHAERMEHIEKIIEVIGDREEPVIVAGDWNATPSSPEIARIQEFLRDAHSEVGQGLGLTFPSNNPLYRIDYIFTSKHSSLQKVETIESLASDHRPVIAEMLLNVGESF